MGCNLFKSGDHDFENTNYGDMLKNKQEGNPNPFNYKINYVEAYNDFLIVNMTYPDCKNFEGNKILVFKNVSIDQLKLQKKIDPHFLENKKFISPIARFEPTKNGLDMARYLCQMPKGYE